MKLKTLHKTIILFAALSITVGSLSTARAATVQLNGGGTAATGITGLTVGITTYDVDFTGSISHNDWATMLDVTSQTEADAVLTAIAAALDAVPVSLIEYDTAGGGTFEHTNTTLFYSSTGPLPEPLLGRGINTIGGTTWGSFIGDSTAPLNNAFPFAVDLVVTAVPTPSAMLLLGTGLLGLIGWNYRRTKK